MAAALLATLLGVLIFGGQEAPSPPQSGSYPTLTTAWGRWHGLDVAHYGVPRDA